MTDWAAKWFEVRAEMGQSDVATMMYQDKGQEIKKVHFHHREADGFGKIQSLLRNEGITIQAPIRPLKKPPGFLHFYLLLKGMITHPRLPHNPWKTFSTDLNSGLPDEVSFWFMTEEENQKLKKMAKDKNLNLGFFILSELDQIIKKQLYKNPEDTGSWLCPVDLRGAYSNAPAGQNFVSFVVAELKGINNPKAVQESFEKYKAALKSGAYWAFWELAQIGRWVGLGGMKWLAKQGTNKHFWMGSFSDLGVWNQEALKNSKVKDRHWVIAPPGSPSYPIGITTIEWCNNRSITMKIHPAICDKETPAEVSKKILAEFKKKLES